jgi:hypothetical protein
MLYSKVLVNFLHDLGVILHFEEFVLEDTHVLEPKWITSAVYKIINAPQLAASKGMLSFKQLEAILHPQHETDYTYPRDKYPYIIELMKKFELCYALDNQLDETVLIPDLLEIQEPAFYFDYANALKFRLDYDFLPKSVMPRFIVKSHKDIKDKLRWRTGVVLTDNFFHTTAVIKSDNEARKIFIHVTGEQPRDYYATIRKTFRDINNSFEKLEVVERVCLPDEPTVTVSISHLYQLEKMGQTTYIPEGANKAYKVKELLGAIGETNEELRILQKLEDNLQEEKEPPKTDTLLLQPNIFGIGINFNQLFKFEFIKSWNKSWKSFVAKLKSLKRK